MEALGFTDQLFQWMSIVEDSPYPVKLISALRSYVRAAAYAELHTNQE